MFRVVGPVRRGSPESQRAKCSLSGGFGFRPQALAEASKPSKRRCRATSSVRPRSLSVSTASGSLTGRQEQSVYRFVHDLGPQLVAAKLLMYVAFTFVHSSRL